MDDALAHLWHRIMQPYWSGFFRLYDTVTDRQHFRRVSLDRHCAHFLHELSVFMMKLVVLEVRVVPTLSQTKMGPLQQLFNDSTG